MNIILIGMPGCGKTTTAKLLARALGREWVDTDSLIEQNYGPIPEIFADRGESGFRKLESGIVAEVSAKDGLVVATGGGCVLSADNRTALSRSGKVIYLCVSVEELLRRLAGDGGRPLLEGDKKGRLESLYSARSEVYESAADFKINCDGLPPQSVCEKILELVK